jgi:hydroxylamine reductase
MQLLYEANTLLGTPQPTQVTVHPVPGKAVLISGHDLHVMYSLLQACARAGINVYTHGEALSAHAYPKLKAFKNLVGHYGGAWNRQAHEFAHFPGELYVMRICKQLRILWVTMVVLGIGKLMSSRTSLVSFT